MLAYQKNEVLTKRDHDKLKATPNSFICFDKGGNASSLRPLIYLFLMTLMKVVTIYWLPGWRILYSYQNKRIRLLRQSLQQFALIFSYLVRLAFTFLFEAFYMTGIRFRQRIIFEAVSLYSTMFHTRFSNTSSALFASSLTACDC